MSSGRSLRFCAYPQALASCASEVSAYALCVSHKNDVKKYDCNEEFQLFKSCFQKKLKDIVSKPSR